MIICPCCGFKFEGDLRVGCTECGARSVGEPLARPLHELPSYGRALFVSVVGAIMLITFLAGIVSALLQSPVFSLDTSSLIAATEAAAWRLKWLALVFAPAALWAAARISASIRRAPSRFMGARAAHGGLALSVLVAIVIAVSIGVTIPERLRQRQRGIEAAYRAQLYTVARAQLEYRLRYGTLPASLDDLKERLPDRDGSIAAALSGIDSSNYRSWSVQARLPEAKGRKPRGTALRRVSLTSGTADDMPEEGVSFTNYELRLPGEDKILGTDDDWAIRDGVIYRPTPPSAGQAAPSIGIGGTP